MLNSIHEILSENGYMEMTQTSDGETGYRFFYTVTGSVLNAVIFVDMNKYSESLESQFVELLSSKMKAQGITTHYMRVMLVNSENEKYKDHLETAESICEENQFAWIFDEKEKRLLNTDNQVEDFYGLRSLLGEVANRKEEVQIEKEEASKEGVLQYMKRLPRVTTAIVVLNIIVFLICTFTGNLLYNIGSVGLSLIEGPASIYRIITAMFLHADISHLFGNMVLLFFLGEIVEAEIGKLPYVVLFFTAGIWGNLASFLKEYFTGQHVVTIGASGAVFGILGCVVSLVLFKRISKQYMRLGRVLVVVAFSLYEGFMEPNVANEAHIGGLIAGFIVGLIICLFSSYKAKGSANEN